MQADARVKAEQLMADLHKKRDEFQDAFRKQTEAGEVAWSRAKAQLETQWNSFETEARKYVETFGKQIEQQQTIFQQVAAAQLKAWRDAADKMLSATADLATDRRADIDATVKRMQASASEAEATFQKLSRAGAESWASLNDALVTSRAAFDRANQAAWDASNALSIPAPEQPDNGVLARHAAVHKCTSGTEPTVFGHVPGGSIRKIQMGGTLCTTSPKALARCT